MVHNCSYFQVTLNLRNNTLEIIARESIDDDQDFSTWKNTPRAVFEEVLSRLAMAMQGNIKSIALTVSENKRIVRDVSFTLPACAIPKAAKEGDEV